VAVTQVKVRKCVRCGTTCSSGEDNPWRPFCSERCKTVDLGGWLTEQHRIPGAAAEDKKDSETDG
jgi:endogenous inhibitor of DNA gyrase (YacG/DUF329 family)